MQQFPSQILTASLAPIVENESFRCITIVPTNRKEESNPVFSALESMQEITLAPKYCFTEKSLENMQVVLIPLVGSLQYTAPLKEMDFLYLEESVSFEMDANKTYSVENPSEQDLISYLQIRFRKDTLSNKVCIKNAFPSDTKNTFLTLFKSQNVKISIGLYEGREEGVYSLQNNQSGILAYVVHGAFELQNRLLETRDALKIWDLSQIELEALSENAIVVIIELLNGK